MKKLLLTTIAALTIYVVQAQTLSLDLPTDSVFIGDTVNVINTSSGYSSYLINLDEYELDTFPYITLSSDISIIDTLLHAFKKPKKYNLRLYGLDINGIKTDSFIINMHVHMPNKAIPVDPCCPYIFNGDFEIHAPSPALNTVSEIHLGIPWKEDISGVGPPGYFGTSDLYSSNAPPNPLPPGTPSVWVPTNIYGDEQAYSGDGYAGIVSFVNTPLGVPSGNMREYLVQELPQSLTPGATYEVSFWVSRADASDYYSKTIGAYFADINNTSGTSIFTHITSTYLLLHNSNTITPQISNEANANNTGAYIPLSSTNGWVEISGTYTVPLGANNINGIIISNFDDYDNNGITSTPTNGVQNAFFDPPSILPQGVSAIPAAYYYIDKVCVKLQIPPAPIINFDVSGISNSCISATIDLNSYINPSAIGQVDFTDQNGNIISGGLFTPQTTGSYTITASILNSCNPETQTINIFDCCEQPNAEIKLLTGGSALDVITQNNGSNIVQNKVVLINNTLNIEEDLTFIDCNIHMGELAEIWVGDEASVTLTLDNTTIKACDDKMWQGIFVNNNEIIIKNESRIEDAIEAVVMSSIGLQSYYTIENSTFNNNIYSLVCHPLTSNLSTFKGNTISNNSPLLYNPNNINKSFIGILLHEPDNIIIGDGSKSLYQNLIKDMDYGVVATEGSFEVYNSSFENINNTSNMLNSAYNVWTSCIYADGGGTPVVHNMKVGNTNQFNKNTFSDFRNAIYTLKMNNHVIGNTFENGGLFGVRTTGGNISFVTDNDYTDVLYGVCATNNINSTYVIDNNHMERTNYNTGGYGIFASNVLSLTPNFFHIQNNCIINYWRGIQLERMNTPLINDNYILRSEDKNIALENCMGGRLYTNKVLGSYSICDFGIKISDSYDTRLKCNYIQGFKEAVHYDGSARHLLFNNTFAYSLEGVVLDNVGEIGEQGSLNQSITNDNKWYGFGLNINRPHLSTKGLSYGSFSPFYTRSSFPYHPSYSVSTSPFWEIPVQTITPINSIYTCPSLPECATTGGSGDDPVLSAYMTDTTLLEAIATSDTAFISDPNVYNNQELLYKSIKDSTDLINSSTELATFVDDKEDESIGLLCSVEEKIEDGLYIDAKATNDSIITYSCCEENCKTIYDKMLASYIRGGELMDLTTTELDTIRDIAYLCPHTDGLAVYMARAICRLSDSIIVDYTNACEQISSNASARMATEALSISTLNIYPNPANSEVSLMADLGELDFAKVQLINSLGQEVGTYLIYNQEELKIDIHNLNAGIYLCNLADDNGNIITTELLNIK